MIILLIKAHACDLNSDLRYRYSFAFLYGLSLGVHASMIIFSPAFILYMLISDKSNLQAKKIAHMLFFVTFGFAIYVFLPFRSLSPMVYDWGDPETFYQFLNQIFDQKSHSEL